MSNIRIASYYGDERICGRNDGGPLFASYCLSRLFGKENVQHLFPVGDLSRFGKFDFHLLVDWGEDALGLQDFEIPHPSAYWTSDTHLGYEYRLSRAKRCDWVFCAQRKAVNDFIRDGIPEDRCFWLPHAFDPLAYSPGIFSPETSLWNSEAVPLKRHDVCFVGNLNDENRVIHLDRIFKEFNNSFFWCTRRFHEAAEIFNKSKIVFNVSARDDANMRLWESLGSKSFLLTNSIPTLGELFNDGEHLVTYQGMDDMIDKAKYYLAHDSEREAIAEAGYKWVIQHGTYMHRTLELLKRVGIKHENVRDVPFDAWKISNATRVCADAAKHELIAS